MNVTDVINLGVQYGNSTINGVKSTSGIISTNTCIPQYMVLIAAVILFILVARDNAKSGILLLIIGILVFVIIGGLGVLV